jgi:hypothetical protein
MSSYIIFLVSPADVTMIAASQDSCIAKCFSSQATTGKSFRKPPAASYQIKRGLYLVQ